MKEGLEVMSSICGCDHCDCWCEDCKEPEIYKPVTPEGYLRSKILEEAYRKGVIAQLIEPIEFKRFRSEDSNG